MRTTLDLPDDLFRKVKAKAAVEGTSLKTLLRRYIEGGLRHPVTLPGKTSKRSPLPIIKARNRKPIPNLTPQLQSALEEEQDFAKLDRSFGR
jgi:hypothetical protein